MSKVIDRVILHVDLNSFFATAEQQANPYLRDKPIGIIKYGVKTGTDVFEARRLCPQIILVPADFDKYADITYRFINICKNYSPVCEVFSLDECFIDVSQTEKFFGGILTIAFEIKDRLRIEIGEWMRCSIGISYNRLLAKLASSQIKPDGLFLITEENVLDLLDKADLMDVCGIGFALNRRLRMLGIDSFVNLRAANLEFLHKHFGPYWSVHLYNTARGIDNSQVLPITEIPDAKSVGRTYTTHRNLYKKTEILNLIRNLCEETTFKARQMRLSGRYIGLVLRSGQSEVEQQLENKPGLKKFYKPGLETNSKELSFYGHRTLKNYIDDGKRLFDICREIFSDWSFGEAQSYMRFCGVTLGMLTRSKYLTTPLFPADRYRQDLIKTVDTINNRFGDYTVYPAQLLRMKIIRPEVNGYFGDKSYRLKPPTFQGDSLKGVIYGQHTLNKLNNNK